MKSFRLKCPIKILTLNCILLSTILWYMDHVVHLILKHLALLKENAIVIFPNNFENKPVLTTKGFLYTKELSRLMLLLFHTIDTSLNGSIAISTLRLSQLKELLDTYTNTSPKVMTVLKHKFANQTIR